MHISKLLSSVFKTNVYLTKESDNVYTVSKNDAQNSTRYALMINNKKPPVVYDRKAGLSLPVVFPEHVTGIPEYVNKPSINPISTLVPLFNRGKILPNPYTKGLCDILDEKSNYRVYPDRVVSFYTNFIDYPKYIGAKEYPHKRSIRGSIMKGSYCVHSYAEGNTNWAIGEGIKECIVAAKVLERYNVIESGGIGNTTNIIDSLPVSDYKLLLGENDSIEAYKKIVVGAVNTQVSYPLEKFKDFADQYLEELSLKGIKIAMEGKDIRHSTVKYKALGVRGRSFFIYVVSENTVHACTPGEVEFALNLVYEDKAWLNWKVNEKKRVFYTLRDECGRVGEYNTDNEFGVGLWTYRDDLLYNTGDTLYKLDGKELTRVKYHSYLNNDFLLIKKKTKQPTLNEDRFDPLPLDKAMSICDWEHKSHYKVLLGFLVQSYYAGDIEFRTNLWIMSDASSAGKTWITTWLKKYVTPGALMAESGKTTPAGLRQLMSDYSTLLYVDEFGEANSADDTNTRKILELFRSSVTGEGKIILGTTSQKPIEQRIRLSTLLSCINGLESIEEQDYERYVPIRLIKRDKKHFYKNIEPAFKALGDQTSFAAYALKRYQDYKEYLPLMQNETRKSLAGHRGRGLASILAGYGVFRGNVSYAYELLEELKEQDKNMFSPFKNIEDTDILLQCLITLYCDTLSKGIDGSRTYTTIHQGIEDDDLQKWGVKLLNNDNELAICTSSFFQLMGKTTLESIKQTTRSSFRLLLKESKYCNSKTDRFVRFGSTTKRCLIFDYNAIHISLGTSKVDTFNENKA